MAGIAIAKEYGGAGLGDLGRAVVMEELGASLCALPYLTTCGIVVDVLSIVGEEAAKAKYLPKIATGELKAAYCDGHHAVNKVVTHVAYADQADFIILSRQMPDGLDYFCVQSNATGLVITPEKTKDPTRSFATVDWSQVADSDLEIIGYGSEERHTKMITQSFIGLAAESIGGAQKCHDMALEYAQQHVQFDHPIPIFQTALLSCANMLTQIEAARSATYAAAIAPPDDKTEAALSAKAYTTDMFFKVASRAVHMHGITDFTQKYPLHYFVSRADENRSMFGF